MSEAEFVHYQARFLRRFAGGYLGGAALMGIAYELTVKPGDPYETLAFGLCWFVTVPLSVYWRYFRKPV